MTVQQQVAKRRANRSATEDSGDRAFVIMRAVVIIGVATGVGLITGVAAGVSAGIASAQAGGAIAGVLAGVISGIAAAFVSGLTAAAALHVLITPQAGRAT